MIDEYNQLLKKIVEDRNHDRLHFMEVVDEIAWSGEGENKGQSMVVDGIHLNYRTEKGVMNMSMTHMAIVEVIFNVHYWVRHV